MILEVVYWHTLETVVWLAVIHSKLKRPNLIRAETNRSFLTSSETYGQAKWKLN